MTRYTIFIYYSQACRPCVKNTIQVSSTSKKTNEWDRSRLENVKMRNLSYFRLLMRKCEVWRTSCLELCLDVIEKEYHSWTSQHGHNHIRKTARNRLQRTVVGRSILWSILGSKTEGKDTYITCDCPAVHTVLPETDNNSRYCNISSRPFRQFMLTNVNKTQDCPK